MTAFISARWVKALREVAEMAAGTGIDLLGVEAQRAGVGEQLLA
jgi:hypothetical protein